MAYTKSEPLLFTAYGEWLGLHSCQYYRWHTGVQAYIVTGHGKYTICLDNIEYWLAVLDRHKTAVCEKREYNIRKTIVVSPSVRGVTISNVQTPAPMYSSGKHKFTIPEHTCKVIAEDLNTLYDERYNPEYEDMMVRTHNEWLSKLDDDELENSRRILMSVTEEWRIVDDKKKM